LALLKVTRLVATTASESRSPCRAVPARPAHDTLYEYSNVPHGSSPTVLAATSGTGDAVHDALLLANFCTENCTVRTLARQQSFEPS